MRRAATPSFHLVLMNKVRKLIIGAALLIAVLPSLAQKKEIGDARELIKTGDYAKAEKILTRLLKKDSANRQNPRIYDLWLSSVEGQYNQANEKFFLKQKADSAAFFALTKRMFDVALTLDSLDARPDERGRVKIEYRKANSKTLNLMRPNLYNGGTYHVGKDQYEEAYDFFDHYLDAARQPLFSAYQYATTDKRMPQAAYWATYCGYKLQKPDLILHYSQLAQQDSRRAKFVLQYVCEAYQLQKEQARYLSALHDGFRQFPLYQYFFPRLADHYMAENRNDSLLALADKGLEADSTATLFLMAKSLALLNMERYAECIAVSKKMIALNDKQPEPYFNIATCYLNQALEIEQQGGLRKQRDELKQLYTDARPYMETYRKLVPGDQKRWAPALYRIYLNLNMGREFEEIDRLMR